MFLNYWGLVDIASYMGDKIPQNPILGA